MNRSLSEVVEELTEELEANRAMFEALCVAARPEHWGARAARGAWSVIDHVAHVASYDRLAVQVLTAADGASVVPGVPGLNADAWNAAQVRERAGRTPDRLHEEMEARRAEALTLLARLRPADLQREVDFPGDSRRAPGRVPLRLWLRAWSKHDMMHARDILSAVPELVANADFQAWLADDPLLERIAAETGRPSGGAHDPGGDGDG